MNFIDVFIVLFAISAVFRGYHIGLVRQAGSTIGFIVGLFLGSLLGNAIIGHISGSLNKSLTSLLIVLVMSFIWMTAGELAGARVKQKLGSYRSFEKFDGSFGSAMAVVTTLLAVWLAGAILVLGPASDLQQALKNSHILATLNRNLPPATRVLSSINKLIDPNGFPQVFSGLEPSPSTSTKIPSLGSLTPAVQQTRASIVKVEGTGCGGIVEGSGFVIAAGEIVTNAHVVAGVGTPKVVDGNGIHDTRVVWFDPNVDLAVLRVRGTLAGKALSINTAEQASSTPAVVEGYPGGGNFDAEPAAIIEHFNAYGRNIYGRSNTLREVYSVQAKVIPGNSGGPLVGSDGRVIGIVFATSTTYNNVGYALTGHQVANELATAEASTTTQSTGACSE